MSISIDQAGRLLNLEIDGTLSATIIPVQFAGEEALSEISRYLVDVVSTDLALTAAKILGHDATVIVTLGDMVRRFEGIVTSLAPGVLWGRGYRAYQLEVRPKLYLATLGRRSRTFTSLSGIDIVKQALQDYGVVATVTGADGGTRPARDWCLQYGESDYNFLSRLLEDEGVAFYFPLDHGNGKLTLVDGINGAFQFAGNALRLGPNEALKDWSGRLRTVPQGTSYTTYDFTVADVLKGNVSAQAKQSYAGLAKVELYCTDALQLPRADFFADTRMQELEAEYETYAGRTGQPMLAPGGRIDISDLNAPWDGKSFMLTRVEHHATCYSQVSIQGPDPEYGNSFTCVPLDTKYRPQRKTPRPVLSGPQTAVVSTDPDQYGRVKVKFHWGSDLESWWVRVAMPWAHNQMGFQFLPRTGSEVVLQFLDGDPERPIIIGAVFNGNQMPVYTPLPDNKTQSGIRGTDPSKTGAPETLNELKFEDKPGSELITFFAQKDFERIVVNNDSLTVRQGNRDVTVSQGDETHTITQGNLTTTLDQGSETRTLKMGDLTTTLEQGSETRELKMGDRSTTLDMGNDTLELKLGNQSTKLDLGAASTEAMQSIELKVGANSVTIDQTGVTIKGMLISIEGQVQTEVKGLLTTVNADALLQVKGAITMIN